VYELQLTFFYGKVSGLYSRKVLILSLLISFACHTAVLSLTTFMGIDGNKDKGKAFKVINVNLHNASLPQEKVQAPHLKNTVENPPRPKNINTLIDKTSPEDKVDLNAENSQYTPYLRKLKRKIEYAWRYPRQSYEKGEEGITIVKFSIDQTGAIVAVNIVSSSGAKLLDQGVLDAIQSTAPYVPLPENMKLSKLHIVATFHYKLSR